MSASTSAAAGSGSASPKARSVAKTARSWLSHATDWKRVAVAAGKGAETEAKRLKDAVVKRETKDRNEAQAVADEIDNKTVVVRLKVGAEDKAFGSITNQDIAAALKAQHRVEIDRHKIDMKEPIRTLGEHEVSLKLHRDVAAHVNVIVTQDR